MLSRLLQNSSILTKAFAASVVLLFCLGSLGITAYLTLDRSARGLTQLKDTNLPKQNKVSELTRDVIATHVKLFRHVTWGSNGVSPALLQTLSDEILTDLTALKGRFSSLESQNDLTLNERQIWINLSISWDKYDRAVRDTLEVASTDAPMGTMMLGGTDDDFQQVAGGLQKLSGLVTSRTRSVTGALADEAKARKWLIVIGGVSGGLISILVTLFVASSIVGPIRSVTQAMSQISIGKTDVRLHRGDRKDEIGQMINAVALFRQNLQQQKDTLNTQNVRFDAAMNAMSQGFCLFDREQKVIVSNARYAEIYRLDREQVKPGTSLRQILDYRRDKGTNFGPAPDIYLNVNIKQANETHELADGRIVSIARHALPDGVWLTTHEDITERAQNERKIAFLAQHDLLTGLANRALFAQKLDEAAKRFERHGASFTVLMLDLDKFKNVNDTLGHPAGDQLLTQVAQRLTAALRETDVLARLGGDEFAIIQENEKDQREGSIGLALRIIDIIGEPFDLSGHRVNVGTSIGVAFAPEHGVDLESLLNKADLALYEAKGGGRNSFCLYRPEMKKAADSQKAIENDLRDAISNQEFELHYQPVMDVETRQLSGVEALVRWRHPSRGLVAPDQFIPLAEATGLILPLGEWVFQQACRDAAHWPAHIKVAINISAVQFNEGNLLEVILRTLIQTSLSPQRLELEITETALLQNLEANLQTMRQLKNLGISIVLDDFGIGYSSVHYLTLYPFDKIKIDKSLTQGAAKSRACAAVVASAMALARGLEIPTTAEGIETEEQFELLRAAGANFAQGFLFGRPVPLRHLGEQNIELQAREVA